MSNQQSPQPIMVGYWELEQASGQLYWSPEIFQILNVDTKRQPTWELLLGSLIESDRDRFESELKKSLDSSSFFQHKAWYQFEGDKAKLIQVEGTLTKPSASAYYKFCGFIKELPQDHSGGLTLEIMAGIFDEIEDLIWVVDRHYALVYANPSFLRVFEERLGVKLEVSQVILDKRFFPEDQIKFWTNVFEKAFNGNQFQELLTIKKGDLSIFWDTSFTPIAGEDGSHFVACISKGISLQKQKDFENKLEVLNSKNPFLENSKDLIFALDQNYRVTYWNSVLEKRFGISRAEVLGKNIKDFVALTNEDFKRAYERVLTQQETVSFDTYAAYIHSWLAVEMFPGEDGLFVIIRDITEQKENEKKIEEFHERFRLISQASNDAIWDLNLITGERYWGEGFETIFEEEISEIRLDNELWLERIHPEDVEQVQKTLDRCIADPNESFFQAEYRFMRKEKGYYYLVDRAIIKRDEQGKAIRMVGAIRNISSRKAYEESLKILNQELRESNKGLEAINKELEQFAFVASHDLQEPIRMISSFMGLIEKKYSSVLDEKGRKYIHYAVDGAKRMRTVILDLLEFSRAGNISEEKKWINTLSVIQEVVKLLAKDIQEKGAILHIGELPDIFCHSNAMVHVFQNLISNALKYQAPDNKPELWIEGQSVNDEWKFSIRDNGIGIEEIYKEKIFIIFQRLHPKDQYSGSGIGLAICKKIVDYHGGKIWVESNPGAGATFFFTIKK